MLTAYSIKNNYSMIRTGSSISGYATKSVCGSEQSEHILSFIPKRSRRTSFPYSETMAVVGSILRTGNDTRTCVKYGVDVRT